MEDFKYVIYFAIDNYFIIAFLTMVSVWVIMQHKLVNAICAGIAWPLFWGSFIIWKVVEILVGESKEYV